MFLLSISDAVTIQKKIDRYEKAWRKRYVDVATSSLE